MQLMLCCLVCIAAGARVEFAAAAAAAAATGLPSMLHAAAPPLLPASEMCDATETQVSVKQLPTSAMLIDDESSLV
jgi:hypothetical protein